MPRLYRLATINNSESLQRIASQTFTEEEFLADGPILVPGCKPLKDIGPNESSAFKHPKYPLLTFVVVRA